MATKSTVLKDKDGTSLYPVTDVSLVVGLQEGAIMRSVVVSELPSAGSSTVGTIYMVPSATVTGEFDRYMTTYSNNAYIWTELGSTAIPSPVIADNLTTNDATQALSAKQGKLLDEKVTQLGQDLTQLEAEIIGYSAKIANPANNWFKFRTVAGRSYKIELIGNLATNYSVQVFVAPTSSSNGTAIVTPSGQGLVYYGTPVVFEATENNDYLRIWRSGGEADFKISAVDTVLNRVNNIEDAIKLGYKFEGLVTPQSSPVDEKGEKLFYLAKENGVYMNFDNIPLQDEVAILLRVDGSANLLNLNGLNLDKYIDAQGQMVDASGWAASQRMNVEVGKVYKVFALVDGVWTNQSSIWYAFYDANGNVTHRGITTAGAFMEAQSGDLTLAVSWNTFTIGEMPMVLPSNYTPTSYIEPDGYQKISISKSESSKKTEIVLPAKLAFVQNKQFDILFDNVLYRGSVKGCGFRQGTSATLYVDAFKDRARVNQPNASNGTAVFRIQLTNDCAYDKAPNKQSNIVEKYITYNAVGVNQGSGVTKKVMFIGDSITANGIYPREVVTLFSNDDMSVQLIGTLGESPANHEGRGGWSAEDYCTKASYNDYTNAFYNPTSQKFDFSYYMSENGFAGVDYVFISLGINDVYNKTKPLSESKYDAIISYYNEMITSIRAYNSSIKIFIGLPILPANSDWALSYNAEITKAERLGLIQRLIQEYDGRESEGFVLVPLYCVVDTERDFPTESRAICARDSSTVEYVTDQTHPKTQGYYKIADVMYTYIKYGTTLS